MNKIANRIFRVIAYLLITSMIIIGCSSSKSRNSEEKIIRIYSLVRDNSLEQSLAKYNSNNKNVTIKYEVGIDGNNSSYTKSDAIKTLNVELMAGKGPDIIILDELPIDIYEKKGLLEDISSVVNKKKDELFPGVYKYYCNSSGEITSFPLKLKLPIIASGVKDTSKVTNLDLLTEEIKSQYDNKVIDICNEIELIYMLYSSCFQTAIKEDKSLDEEEIKKFLTDIKDIYFYNYNKLSEDDINNNENYVNEVSKKYNIDDFYSYSIFNKDYLECILFSDKFSYSLGYIGSATEFEKLEGSKNYNNIANYSLWKGMNNKNIFIPVNQVAKIRRNLKTLLVIY